MNQDKPRISIIVITYNQENLIGRALDSLLCQKEYVYEIIVSDDCSQDSTYEEILNYKQQFPDLIKASKNEINLGIFANMESTYSKVSGDIVFFLAGDDTFCDGLFKATYHFINEHSINYKDDLFSLYFNFKEVLPSGKVRTFSNDLITKFDPVGLKIRELVVNRSVGISRKVFEKLYPVRKDIGLYADGLIDIQIQLFSTKFYYIPFVASIYYHGLGINSRTSQSNSILSKIKFLKQLKQDIITLKIEDKVWLDYIHHRLKLLINPTFKRYIIYLYKFTQIIKINYGFMFFKRELKLLIKYTLIFVSIYKNKVTS